MTVRMGDTPGRDLLGGIWWVGWDLREVYMASASLTEIGIPS
jgi:hypothetical protein